MPRGRLYQLVIPLAAFIPILPLLIHGCSCGHDFDFHIPTWLEAAHQFSQGNLHPHWAFNPAYNAGEPRFVFYPPISWTLGAILSTILGLVFKWSWTPILYTWIVLAAAGFSLHRLARDFATPTATLLAAVFYIVNPYMLFTAYERTAYAELLAAVWIPLLFHAILSERVTIPRIAIPVALLWITNAPAAVVSSYALALLTFIRLVLDNRTRTRFALTTTAGTLLGLGLASIYLVPAAYERRYIQFSLAIQTGFRIQDNLIFHHTTAGLIDPSSIADALVHDQVLHAASVIAVSLLTLTTVASRSSSPPQLYRVPHPWQQLAKGGNETAHTRNLSCIAILTLTIAFLLTPLSLPIWNHVPELGFLQFPWRIVALLAAALSLTLAIALTRIRLSAITTTALALTIAATITYPAYTLFRQGCDPGETPAERVALLQSHPGASGSEAHDEYTPITANNDALSDTNPPYWLAAAPTAQAPTNSAPGPAPLNLTLNSPIPQTLILNLRDYPAWRVTLNQRHRQPISRRRKDGLIAIPIPAGPAQIYIAYATLPDKIIGTLLTVLSLFMLSLVTLRSPT